MPSAPARWLAALLAVAVVLPACSSATGAVADARDAVETAIEEATDDPGAATLTVANATDGPICDVHVTDLDEPDSDGYDLLAEGDQLAPGASLSHAEGDHPESDDHNLVATARACDGTEYADFHFSYPLGGGTYTVSDAIAQD